MNKVYRVVWNKSLGTWVAVSETAKSKTKSRSKTVGTIAAASLMVTFSAQVLAASYAVGGGSAPTANSIAIGDGATTASTQTTNNQSIAIGNVSTASGDQAIALGANVVASGNSSIAIGGDDLNLASRANQDGTLATNINGGDVNTAFKKYSGRDLVDTTNQYPTTRSSGTASVAIGVQAVASGGLATAFGTQTKATGVASSAFGVSAIADKEGSVAIGAGSKTDGAATKVQAATVNGVEFTGFVGNKSFAGTAADAGRQVSVGLIGNERQIKNVAPGELSATSTDAINGSQIYAVSNKLIDNIKTVDAKADAVANGTAGLVQQANSTAPITIGAATGGTTINVTGSAGNRVITGLANGTAATDAATFGQLSATNTNVTTNTNNIVGNTNSITNLQNQTFKLRANSDTATAVGASDTVTFLNGSNVNITRAGNNVTIGTSLTPTFTTVTSTGAVTAGSLSTGGTLTVAGTSNLNGGANLNNQKITNVANGTAATDAATFGQLSTTNTNVATNTTNIAKNASNITANTTNITTNTQDIDDLTQGKIGIVRQDTGTGPILVGSDTGGMSVNFRNDAGTKRTLTGIRDGEVSIDSTEAVTGAQLYNTNQDVVKAQTTANTALTTANKGFDISADNGTTNNVQLGETVKFTNADGNLVATVSDNGINYDLADKITVNSVTAGNNTFNVDGVFLKNSDGDTSISGAGVYITDTLNNSAHYAADNLKLTDYNTGKGAKLTETELSFTDNFIFTGPSIGLSGINAGDITIKNVAAGVNATDAVNKGQLDNVAASASSTNDKVDKLGKDTANNLGSGAKYDATTGNMSSPAYMLESATDRTVKTSVNNVGDALGNLDARTAGNTNSIEANTASINTNATNIATNKTNIATNATNITANKDAITTNATNISKNASSITDLTEGRIGIVRQDAGNGVISVGGQTGGSVVNFANNTKGTRTLTGLSNGNIAAGSSDAVTGDQLNTTNTKVASAQSSADKAQLSADAAQATADKGFNITSNGSTNSDKVALGETVNFTNTDGNLVVSHTDNGVAYNLATNISVDSVTAGNSKLTTGGLKVTDPLNNTTGSYTANSVNLISTNRQASYSSEGFQIVDKQSSTVSLLNEGRFSTGRLDPNTNMVTDGSVVSPDFVYVGDSKGVGSVVNKDGFSFSDGVNGTTPNIMSTSPSIQRTGIDAGNTVITSVAAGVNGTDAVNKGQLDALATASDNKIDALGADTESSLGGGAKYNAATGNITSPTYTLDDGSNIGATIDYNNVGDALGNLDARTTSNTSNIATNATNISKNASSITDLTEGRIGIVRQDAGNGVISVGGQTGGSVVNFANSTKGTRTLTGLSNGNVAAGSTDAVTGDQLNATNNDISSLQGKTFSIQANGDTATAVGQNDTVQFLDGDNIDITRNGNNITVATARDVDFDKVTTGNSELSTNGLAIDTGNRRTSINSLGMVVTNDQLDTATYGVERIRLTDDTGAGSVLTQNSLTFVNGSGATVGASISTSGVNAGNERITNVANGISTTDAINRGQLDTARAQINSDMSNLGFSTASNLGGGATYNSATHTISSPTYILNDGKNTGTTASYNNVGDALGNLDARTTTNTSSITDLTEGRIGIVRQDAGNGVISVGGQTGGSVVNFANNTKGTRTLTGLSNGNVAAGSSDAVTGDQLHATNTNVTTAQTSADKAQLAANAAQATADKGFNISADNGTANNVKLGETVDFTNTDGNLVATVSDNGINYDLAKAISVDSVTAGDTVLNTSGLSFAGNVGPSISATGISAGNTKITNVADAIDATDAVNKGQLDNVAASASSTNDKVDKLGKDTANNLGGGAKYNAATGNMSSPAYMLESATDRTVKTSFNNVGDALGNLDARTSGNTNSIEANTASINTNATNIATNKTNITANKDAITTNATNISKNTNSITDLTEGRVGIVRQDAGNGVISVGGQTGGSVVNFANNTKGTRTLTGLSNGNVAAGSSDAVTGDQLNATNTNVTSAQTSADKAQLAANTAQATADKGFNISANNGTANNVQLGETVDFTNTDGNLVATVSDNGINYDLAKAISVDSVTAGDTVLNTSGLSFAGNVGPSISATGISAGNTKITNVADAIDATDAVNKGQLDNVAASASSTNDKVDKLGKDTANNLGGGAKYDATTGNMSSPAYMLESATDRTVKTSFNNVGDALGNLDARTSGNTNSIEANTASINTNATNIATNKTNIATNATNITANKDAIATNATNISKNTNSITDLTEGRIGIVRQDAGNGIITVGGQTGGSSVSFAGTDGTRTLTGLSNGNVAAGSSDAVTGDQLNATNTNVTSAQTSADKAQLAANTAQATADKGFNISANNGTANNVQLGETVNFTNTDGNLVATVSDNGINYDLAKAISVDSVMAGDTVLNTSGLSFAGNVGPSISATGISAGNTKITNVADAIDATDAVNKGQLDNVAASASSTNDKVDKLGQDTANNLGGGAKYNAATGNMSSPAYMLESATDRTVKTSFNNVGDALGNLDARTSGNTNSIEANTASINTNATNIATNKTNIATNATNITANKDAITTNATNISKNANSITDLTEGRIGIVRQDAGNGVISVGGQTGGSVVNFANNTKGTRTLTGLSNGNVAAGSSDAVTGDQLNATNNSISSLQSKTFSLQTNGDTASVVGQSDTVQFLDGDNINVTRSGNDITIATARDVDFDKVTTGNSVLDTDGLLVTDNAGNTTMVSSAGTMVINDNGDEAYYGADQLVFADAAGAGSAFDQSGLRFFDINGNMTGPSVLASGIDAGGMVITNVANGVNPNDAVNKSQLDKVIASNVTDVTVKDSSGHQTTVNTTEQVVNNNVNNQNADSLFLTYNVEGQDVTDRLTIGETVQKMNTEGVKFAHTNATVGTGTLGATNDSSAGANNSTAIGVNAIVEEGADSTIALGHNTMASKDATNAVVLGADSQVSGESAVAVGYGAQANGSQSIAIGTGNIVNGNNSGAFGDPSIINGNNSYAFGNDNIVETDNTFVLGNNVTQTTEGSVVLGNGSAATTGAGVIGYRSTDAGVIATTSTTGAVSVGNRATNTYRQITGVAAGTEDSDAVNVAQLKAVDNDLALLANSINSGNVGLVQQAGNQSIITIGGSTGGTIINAAGTNGDRQITGVAASGQNNAAATVGQVKGAVDALGGGARVNSDGSVTGPTYNVQNGTQNNVGDALTALDSAINNVQASTQAANAALKESSVQYETDANGNVNKEKVTLGGGTNGTTLTNVKAGELSATSKDAVNGSQLYATNQQVNQNTNDINSLTDQINQGGVGLVKQDSTTKNITVAASTGGNSVNIAGTDGDRKLSGVAAGSVSATSNQAVNGSQLYNASASMATALGGGASVNSDGSIAAPSYSISGETYRDVGSAFQAVDENYRALQGEMNQAFYYTNERIDDVEKQANAGIAAALSLESAPFVPGKITYAVGAGYHRGENAIGGSLRRTSDNGRWSLTGGIATDSEGGASARVGISGVIN